MSFTTVTITINPSASINTFGRLLRAIGESEATEEYSVEVD